VLDAEQTPPVDAQRWYGLSQELWLWSLAKGYVDFTWDGHGRLIRKRMGPALDQLEPPRLPARWNGTRVTMAVAAYWPEVLSRWEEVMARTAATPGGERWLAVPRVAFINVGEWYKLSRGDRSRAAYPRSAELFRMPLPSWTALVYGEAEEALRGVLAWADAHDADGAAPTQLHVGNVPCDPSTRECRDALRQGLAGILANVADARLRLFDVAALADAAPDEQHVNGHPSLLLSNTMWNLWFANAFAADAAGEAQRPCEVQRVRFGAGCSAEAMLAAMPKGTRWEVLQQQVCRYNVTRQRGGGG
jgi:hypothetical protein